MNIINITEKKTKDFESRMIKVETDKGNFVYFKDKFKTLEALEAEINKHISLQAKREAKKAENTIISQFKQRIK